MSSEPSQRAPWSIESWIDQLVNYGAFCDGDTFIMPDHERDVGDVDHLGLDFGPNSPLKAPEPARAGSPTKRARIGDSPDGIDADATPRGTRQHRFGKSRAPVDVVV